ncbi:acid-sensing ion channel 2 isoform X2 [Kryptolebias marmoratus]|uniref:acid-sensing ion channel 2 isoform X2 n=1 Tax=Kryptolebias marmoratus TaxID=37003 RepID=UPI0007F86E5F|nr:acid-sensing ion channel 2 isoform X2 [Kryptolebias marmoratus]XP_017274914.1 acid-sensing ion channel 2 isoform X2 [Kryptolebias marmoratus]XP_017274915.1 acid-sensing ion channel 2 isoform X2 [Kryptolebias marmoratus]XP_017274916.1 acid-sensing ion channel 2 isoform X2 [Kryptolebias marmoratus]XP_024862406.1 acid-sensing ion channel 2 isoform X2 [Kryptolebias marmoratus]XP_024862407.1 acid-sensing ion channel 2 isoform X2 [Kryptolebias marmoratus]XP_024862408.1 acid-sensing ion channel 2
MDLKESCGSQGSHESSSLHPTSWQAFASTSTLHGLRFVFPYERAGARRLLWAAALLACLGLLALESTERLAYFFSYPHVTSVDAVASSSLVFPAVTICNLNAYRFSHLTSNDLYHAGELLALLDVHLAIPQPHLAEPDVLAFLQEKTNFTAYKPKAFSMKEFIDRVGHDLNEMMLSCKYQGQNCTHGDFKTVFTRYGKCYMFNAAEEGKTLRTTMKGGTGNGLEIMLDIQQDEYLPVWGDTDDTAFEAGVRVQIHSQAEPPFVHELGFGVAPGFQTFVATQEQRLTYLPPPWGECESRALESGFFQVYSVTACRIDCETRYIVENCNCRMVHMPGDASYCTPEQYKDCAEPALAKLSAVESSSCMCRTPCNMTRYNKELSMVKIPSKTSARYLQKKFNKSEKYITDNILVLDVFFEALNYETIEQKKAYEVAGLLGDIGGQMGLFIGASILTILELFDYAYEVVKDRLLDLLSREEEDESHAEEVSSCDPVANHSESISHTVTVPLQTTLGTLEEIAC